MELSIRRLCRKSSSTSIERLDDGSDENSRPSPGAAGEVPPGLARCGTRTHGCSATGMSTDSGLDNGSRMTRECHVRFCERLRGKFPRSTHHFGMKAHIGVDSKLKLIHSVAATAANVHDSQLLPDLLHGKETRVWGDSAYTGQGEVIREHAHRAQDFTHQKGYRNRPLSEADATRNRTKSRVRAKVEHPFLVLKRIFGFNKVRYRGLDKNANRLFVACGLVNLYMVRRQLLRPT